MPHLGNEQTQLFYATVLRPWRLSDVENFPEGGIGPVTGIGLAEGAGSASGVGYQIGSEGLAAAAGSASGISFSEESETTAWVSAVVTAGGSVSSGRRIIVNDLIAGLKADSLWTKLDRLWVFAAENTQSALIDMKALDTASPVDSPNFTADQGYTSTAENYVNTTYNPSTDGSQLTQNSASLFVWNRTGRSAADWAIAGCTSSGGVSLAIYPLDTDNFTSYAVNRVGYDGAEAFGSAGFFHATRTTSSNTEMFIDGESFDTGSATSGTVPNQPVYVCARNSIGAAQDFTEDQVACVGVGAGMNSTEAANLYNRISDYMTAIGA